MRKGIRGTGGLRGTRLEIARKRCSKRHWLRNRAPGAAPRRLRAAPGPLLGPTLKPTWAQLGANLGLRRGCFPLWGENDEMCAGLRREHDFRPPGGSKTGLDSGLNSIFESSSAEDAISKPFWRLLKRLPADLGPTWGRLGADLGPTWGPKGVREGVRRGSKIVLGGLRGPRGHLEAIWAPFGGVLGVNVGSKIACFRSLLGGTSGSRMSKKRTRKHLRWKEETSKK